MALIWGIIQKELIDHVELSPSWEAASHSAIQEFPSILWNPKVHYHVHKCRSTGPYLEADESSPYHLILFL
jgi:hypothetical protein